jgi:ParB-like chromosome segregation protein Spo0J
VGRHIHPDELSPSQPNTHSKKQINQIAASIRQFGFTNPILIDQTAVFIAGHESASIC